ncbi:thioredoxin TrxC [Vibrio rumoiensis]|uniref:Thioredoxin n=1 Tax=Vibrio rumoiensis 1S-45 TaxID=1188252 RepID=A0A1E5E4E3_9VIBR|nr:thioredoxin TrxC [Vibrio rumoiensis]OEF27622.1 thioredoxin TrxC [Vibrio rumoiensis 1S-45]
MTTFTTPCPHCQGNNKVPLERVADHANCGRCKSPLFDGKPITGTSNNFNALLKSTVPVVVDFWAPWCNPCVGFAPVFEDTASDMANQARFIKIDTESEQNIADLYQIRSIPTIMVFKDGKQVDMINGALPKGQFTQWLTQALKK